MLTLMWSRGQFCVLRKCKAFYRCCFLTFTSLLPVPMDPLLTTKCTNGRTTKIIFHRRPLMAIHELGVHEWDWVHERLLICPRAQPKGIKNVHALNPIHEPRSYIILWWTILHTPLFCRFIPLIFQKYTKTHHLYCLLSTFKSFP